MEGPVFDHRTLTLDDVFEFSCYPGISCFNLCCYDVNLILSPYDFLRIRLHLGLTPQQFIDKYCDLYLGDITQLPVISVRMNTHDFSCPFLTKEGCSIYKDRPSSCRTYPLARFTMLDDQGQKTEIYRIIRETHCKGHFEKRPISVRDWIKEQGLEPYHQFNDLFGEIILARKQMADTPLSADELDAIYIACYDLERFRQKIEKKEIQGLCPEEIEKALQSEPDLLKLGLSWLKKTVFKKIFYQG